MSRRPGRLLVPMADMALYLSFSFEGRRELGTVVTINTSPHLCPEGVACAETRASDPVLVLSPARPHQSLRIWMIGQYHAHLPSCDGSVK